MSAGSQTEPGGYATHKDALEQFEVTDPRSVPEVTGALNKALSEVKADGTYDALVAKYFGK